MLHGHLTGCKCSCQAGFLCPAHTAWNHLNQRASPGRAIGSERHTAVDMMLLLKLNMQGWSPNALGDLSVQKPAKKGWATPGAQRLLTWCTPSASQELRACQMHFEGPQYQPILPRSHQSRPLSVQPAYVCQAWTPHLSCITSVPAIAARAASTAPFTPPSDAAIWSRQLWATRCSSMGRSTLMLAWQSARTLQTGQRRVRSRQHMLQIHRQASCGVGLRQRSKQPCRGPECSLWATHRWQGMAHRQHACPEPS